MSRAEKYSNKEHYGGLTFGVDCHPHFNYWRHDDPHYLSCENWTAWPKWCAAELLGTMFIVFIGTHFQARMWHTYANGISSLGTGLDGSIWELAHGLIWGLTYMAATAGFAHFSNGHFNPAVTAGHLVTGQCQLVPGLLYIVFQIIGGILGALWTYLVMGDNGVKTDYVGSCQLAGDVKNGEAFILEATAGAFVVMVFFATMQDQRPHWRRNRAIITAPIAVGFAYAVAIIALNGTTGGAVNPARALGPAVVSTEFQTGAYVHFLAPIVGGIIGAAVYQWFWIDLSQYDLDSKSEALDVGVGHNTRKRSLGTDDDYSSEAFSGESDVSGSY